MTHVSIHPWLQQMVDKTASDLYITYGYPPSLRVNDIISPLNKSPLAEEDIKHVLTELLSPDQVKEFESLNEFNTAIAWQEKARFRINVFRQQQRTGVVIRRIQTNIPTLESLKLPAVYGATIMEKRGLILMVGPTGSGKSTSLAAMIGHRNDRGNGHIITIEDPIEFVHAHKGCIITQRDVGIDTYSFGLALKNALRQRPDVVLIGEIRDTDTMEQAIMFAETGHLCLATLHANNANQAIERVLNFFPEEKHQQVLLNLSLNLKAIFAQRLIPGRTNERVLALEIMLNRGLIKNLIEEGKIKEMKEIIEKNREVGMQSFDQSLLDYYLNGTITDDTAIAEADNAANLRLQIKQHVTTGKIATTNPGFAINAPRSNEVKF